MDLKVSIPLTSVNFVDVPQAQSTATAAAEESANVGGFSLPGVLFRQGARFCISTAVPIRRVRTRMLDVDSAPTKGNVVQVQRATNRPVMPEHVATIANYLADNVGGTYILPPMTLNVQQPITVYRPQHRQGQSFGQVHLVIPETAKLSVTDGGHRTNAIIQAYESMSEEKRAKFDDDAVAVMITLEGDLSQIHQDFADCSKTKALPKSQLAAYDRRNPANGLVLDIIDKCLLFNDKIDSTSKTLSVNSTNLFLTNQVRQLVKELLTGDYAMADDQFEIKAKDLLGSSETKHYQHELDRFVAYIDTFTSAIPVLMQIANLPPGTPRNVIKDRRNEGWICLTATGMVILGRIGYELFKDEHANWQELTKRLGSIDWSREGGLWRNNIVRAGKMTTQRAPVRIAVEQVRRAIGLTPNTKLDADLQA